MGRSNQPVQLTNHVAKDPVPLQLAVHCVSPSATLPLTLCGRRVGRKRWPIEHTTRPDSAPSRKALGVRDGLRVWLQWGNDGQ